MTIYELAPARLTPRAIRKLDIILAVVVIGGLFASIYFSWPRDSTRWDAVFVILFSVSLASTFIYRVSSIDRLFTFGLTAAILAVIGPYENPLFAASAWTVAVLLGLCVLYRNFNFAADAALSMWVSALALVGSWQLMHALVDPIAAHTDGWLGFVLSVHLPQIVVSILCFYLARIFVATLRAMLLTRFRLRQILLRLSWQRIGMMCAAEVTVAGLVGMLAITLNRHLFAEGTPFGKTTLILLVASLVFGLSGRWTVRTVRARLDSVVGATLKLPWPEDEPVQTLALEFAREALPKYRISAVSSVRETSRDHIRSVPIAGDNETFTLIAVRRAHQSPFRLEDQQILESIAQIANETARARNEVFSLRREANTDRLTGLLNYRAFYLALDDLAEHHDSDQLVALIFIDIDNFKMINDTHGHEVGNNVLQVTAQRIRDTVADPCLVARVGGDEFVIMLPQLSSPDEANELQERLQEAVSAPIELGNGLISLRISQGIAFSKPDQRDFTPLVELADRRMYASRGNLLNTAAKAPRVPSAQVPRLHSTTDVHPPVEPGVRLAVRDAILKKRLQLVYQPIVSLRTEHIISLEALMRYHDPVHGTLPVALLLSEAQSSGLLPVVSEQLLDLSVAGIERISEQRAELCSVHLNISLQQLLDDSFLRHVDQITTEHSDITLVLEVNELSLRDSTPETVSRVSEFAEQFKAKLAVDDIGQGYTGLASLRDYPFDIWKVDSSVVRQFEHTRARPIAQSLLRLSRELGAEVIFEGVETQAQHEWLLDIGAERAQGFYYGRPMAIDEMLLRLEVAGTDARL